MDVKVTWGLVWAFYWRMLLIGLGITVIIWLIMFLVLGGTALLPFFGG